MVQTLDGLVSWIGDSICSVLEVWELYLISGLASDGDWAPNDQMGKTGWVLGEYPNDPV